jgi:uncharacterized protein
MNRFSLKIRFSLLPLALVIWATPFVRAQGVAERFSKSEVMVTMRDGIKLYTTVYAPKAATVPLPIVFMRTPYGIDDAAGRISSSLKELSDDGYLFAFQDARGKFKSEGEFVMQRPPRTDPKNPKAIDEGTDAYDTIDWLVKNVPNNNGRVGMRLADDDGADRAAPGAARRFAASLARRHVSRRRLSSQRRFPFELRV